MKMSELDKSALAFYTGKWFLLWSFKFACLGLMGICAILTFLAAACRKDN